ncbi:NAD(P)-binding protein [Streptomyces altiplanensis]
MIGGGVAGLVSAVACAEAGVRVDPYEAHGSLGGRGRATPAPYVAHEDPHVFYSDLPHWKWLTGRGLTGPVALPPLRRAEAGFVRDGRLRLVPPAGLARMVLPGRPRTAPVDETFHAWASRRYGESTARAAANALGVRCAATGGTGWWRTTWQRTATAKGRTGALGLPGATWRGRPAIDRGDGVFLAGDMAAAPGVRGEIAIFSGIRAAEGAVRAVRAARAARSGAA